MKTCSVDGCNGSLKMSKGFCGKHYKKFMIYGDPLGGRTNKHKSGEGFIVNGYRVLTINGEKRLKHRVVIEKSLGHKIPVKAETHHVDGDRDNNANSNLVLCDSVAYHKLLHMREKALSACGHAEWRICEICHQYDDPKNMYISKTNKTRAVHKVCSKEKTKRFRSRPGTIARPVKR